MAPRISIIIPVYNRAHTVKAAIDSVLEQSFTDYELIVVDDGSTDNSVVLIEGYKDERIKLLKLSNNKGAAAARNAGVSTAVGDYVALLDSDDIWYPKKLQMQLDYMEDMRSVACCTSFKLVTASGKISERHLVAEKDWVSETLLSCRVSPGSTMMAKRSLFSSGEVGLWREDLRRLEDWDWLLRLLKHNTLHVMDSILTEVRISGYPAYQTVQSAADQLWETYRNEIGEYGLGARRLFHASLYIEKSYAAYRNKAYLQAIIQAAIAGIICPKRLLIFLSRGIKNSPKDSF